MICNNVSNAHRLKEIDDGDTAMRVICQECWKQFTIRKDPIKGVPEKRQYAKIFKRDIMQGNDNLLYKYHHEFLKT